MAERFEPFDWYEVPLYYDIVFEEDTHLEGEFLAAMHARFCESRGKRALEPACGTGRVLAEAASRGFQVTGFDLSEPSLQFGRRRLRERKLRGTLQQGRMESFRLPGSFDLAFCLVSTFKYLLTEQDARRHLKCMHDALAPGGIYVLGFHLSDYQDKTRSRERWVGQRRGTRVTCNIQSWPPDPHRRLERVRSRLVVEEKGSVRRFETSWDFRTYQAAQFRRLLRSVPGLEHVATYDFTYQLGRRRERFDDEQLDNVVILRRRA